jgi:Protein of unknown function (DUF559)
MHQDVHVPTMLIAQASYLSLLVRADQPIWIKLLQQSEAGLICCYSIRPTAAARFNRQIATGDCIADFVCRAHKLIVEVGGEAAHHFCRQA